MSTKDEMISVPVTVLQDQLWNIQLGATGITEPNKCDEAIERQCNALQEYLTPADYVDPNEGLSFDDFDNGEFVNFRKPV